MGSEKEELELQLRQVPDIERRIAELEAVVRERELEEGSETGMESSPERDMESSVDDGYFTPRGHH